MTGDEPGFFNFGVLDHGERRGQRFSEAGSCQYVCDSNRWMTGTITVVE